MHINGRIGSFELPKRRGRAVRWQAKGAAPTRGSERGAPAAVRWLVERVIWQLRVSIWEYRRAVELGRPFPFLVLCVFPSVPDLS